MTHSFARRGGGALLRRAASLLVALGALAFPLACAPPESPRPVSPAVPLRIVSMAPNVTEMLFAIGAGGQVVAITEFCTFPPEAQKRAKVGGYLNPDLETLVALRPDLVVLAKEHQAVIEHCRRLRIPTLELALLDLDDVFANIETLGERTGHAAQARTLVTKMRADLDETRRRVAPQGIRKTLLVIGSTGPQLANLTSVGRASFLSELLPYAGGASVFTDVEAPYFSPSKEQILERAPEVIVETVGEGVGGDSSNPSAGVMAGWGKLAALPAVQNGRVVRVTGSFLHIPGPRITETARVLARAIHPEAFAAGTVTP